jgi:ABC-type polysaccharide/polyol phosphate transport system ATPase subunit
LRHVFGGAVSDASLWALRNVSFQVEKGEAFGIVGANGSGKSTLLQIIAGILRPTTGTLECHGRLAALLELGSGFAPEFTGRQNVFLNASILGLSHSETEALLPAIERFAAIGDFIDQPIRTYSTGMVLRLAFAVSAHVDPEILVVDEALAVGDIAFRQRCMRRIHDLRASGTTILYVSHDSTDVKALCERCLWLDRGEMRALGESDAVIAQYLSASLQKEARPRRPAGPPPEVVTTVTGTHRYGNRHALITGVELDSSTGTPVTQWTPKAAVVLRVGFRVDAPLPEPIVGYLVRNAKGETIFGTNTAREDYPLPEMNPGDVNTVDFHWTVPELAPGRYFVSVAVSEGTLERFEVCDYVEDAIAVENPGSPEMKGYLRLPCAGVTIHR